MSCLLYLYKDVSLLKSITTVRGERKHKGDTKQTAARSSRAQVRWTGRAAEEVAVPFLEDLEQFSGREGEAVRVLGGSSRTLTFSAARGDEGNLPHLAFFSFLGMIPRSPSPSRMPPFVSKAAL